MASAGMLAAAESLILGAHLKQRKKKKNFIITVQASSPHLNPATPYLVSKVPVSVHVFCSGCYHLTFLLQNINHHCFPDSSKDRSNKDWRPWNTRAVWFSLDRRSHGLSWCEDERRKDRALSDVSHYLLCVIVMMLLREITDCSSRSGEATK